MGETIILANIGNRNIRYLNQGFEKDEIPKDIFLESTKYLLEHPENWHDITINILPSLLEQFPTCRLYLFVTKQEPIHRQDTIYEGHLLKKLIARDHPNVETEVVEMGGIRPHVEDELIPWYRNKVLQLKQQWNDRHFIMYDTGGTPQQKNALKTVLEFYFKEQPSDTISTSYSLLQGYDNFSGSTTVEPIQSTASEKLTQLTNIKLLCRHYNYEGALQLSGPIENKPLTYLLEYSVLRWNNMWNEIKLKKGSNQFSKGLKKMPEFKIIQHADTEYILKQEEDEDGKLHPIALRECQNLASKANDQASVGNFSGSILTLHQLIERFIASIIEYNSPHHVYTKFDKAEQGLLNEIDQNFHVDFYEIFGNTPHSATFPVLLYYATKCCETDNLLRSLIEEIRDTQSTFRSGKFIADKSLNTLRNAIAHKGHGVKKEEFTQYQPLLDNLYAYLVKGKDPFDELNKMIEKLM